MIDLNETYFLASARYDKESPEDFGLTAVNGTEQYVDESGALWSEAPMWDIGFGDEYGFIRQPELGFDDLWSLLTESKVNNNRSGAAYLINEKYPEEMRQQLIELFKSNARIKGRLRKGLDLLEFGVNRSKAMGKPYQEVERDFQSWTSLKIEYERRKSSW